MPSENNTPAIRFAGFSGEWKRRKLGEICDEFKSGDFIPASEISKLGTYPVFGGNGLRGFTQRHNHSGEYAIIGRQGALCGNVNYSTGQAYFTEHAIAVRANRNNETRFIFYLLKLLNLGQYSAQSAQPGLAVNKIIALQALLPSKAEQTKVAAILSILDTLITLHRRKCELLETLKKSMLEKLFPKEGELVPELRFAGFTGEWERRTVGEYGYFYYGRSAPKWSVSDEAPTPCVRYGELYMKFGCKIDTIYSYTSIPRGNLIFSKGTEVLIPRVGEDPMDYNHCTWLSLEGIAIGEMISVYNTQQNPLFTAIMFNATLQEEFAKRVEGGSVTNLYYDKLKNIEVSFPSLAEQEKIAAVFAKLDTLLTPHRRKLELLQNIKKACLEKMFV